MPPPPQAGRIIAPFQHRAVRLARWTMLGAAVILGPWAKAETHTFTNYDGKPLVAEIVTVEHGEVVVKRPDGKAFSLDLHDLPAADKAYVKTWQTGANQPRDASATTDSDIEISIDATPMDGSITPKVTLVNRETALNFKGLNGTLVLVGHDSKHPEKFKVLATQKFTANLAADGKFEFTGEAFPSTEKAAKPEAVDWVCDDYLFVLQNAEGNILQLRHSEGLRKTGMEALKLAPGAVFLLRPSFGSVRSRVAPRRNLRGQLGPTTSVLPLHLRR